MYLLCFRLPVFAILDFIFSNHNGGARIYQCGSRYLQFYVYRSKMGGIRYKYLPASCLGGKLNGYGRCSRSYRPLETDLYSDESRLSCHCPLLYASPHYLSAPCKMVIFMEIVSRAAMIADLPFPSKVAFEATNGMGW